MTINTQKLVAIMRNNHIQASDIFNYNPGVSLSEPNEDDSKILEAFFHEKYPYINFNYLTDSSPNPNNFLDPFSVNYTMTHKGISRNTFNSFVKAELGVTNAYTLIGSGAFPQTEEQAECIKNYLDTVIDNGGNHTSPEGTKEAMEEKKMENRQKVVEACTKARTMYIQDPENWMDASELNPDRIKKIIKDAGYSETSFIYMVCPSNYTLFYRWLNKKASVLSLPKMVLPAIGAAIQANRNYVKGLTDYITTNRIPNFPRDEAKDFVIKRDYLATWDRSIIELLASNASIPVSIFDRIIKGEKIAFNDTLIKKMFKKNVLNLIGKDVDEVIYSFSNNYINSEKKESIVESNTDTTEDTPPVNSFELIKDMTNTIALDTMDKTAEISDVPEDDDSKSEPKIEVHHNPKDIHVDAIVKFLSRSYDKESVAMIQELAANRVEYLNILDKYNYHNKR